MKIKTAICLLTSILLLAGCQPKKNKEITNSVGVDASAGSEVLSFDDHGGFHGDGTSCVVLEFNDNEDVMKDIESDENWRSLPFDENITALVYGVKGEGFEIGPYLTDENGESIVPDIQNGYYCFIDRHSESENKYDDSQVLNRSSLNFTLAIYDTDTDRLYFIKMDT